MHCGECGVIDFCGTGFGYSICSDERFQHVEVDEYKRIAEQASFVSPTNNAESFSDCENCNGSGLLDDGQDCDDCDAAAEYNDEYAHYVADFVHAQLTAQE